MHTIEFRSIDAMLLNWCQNKFSLRTMSAAVARKHESTHDRRPTSSSPEFRKYHVNHNLS